MWYRCEVMGQSNQVHQLKLLTVKPVFTDHSREVTKVVT